MEEKKEQTYKLRRNVCLVKYSDTQRSKTNIACDGFAQTLSCDVIGTLAVDI